MIGWLLCRLGRHRWAGPDNTLPDYCVRCGHIDLDYTVQWWEWEEKP